jgi:hypothetical protein
VTDGPSYHLSSEAAAEKRSIGAYEGQPHIRA